MQEKSLWYWYKDTELLTLLPFWKAYIFFLNYSVNHILFDFLQIAKDSILFILYIYNVYQNYFFNKFLSPYYKLNKILKHLNSVIFLIKMQKKSEILFPFDYYGLRNWRQVFLFLFFFRVIKEMTGFYHLFDFVLIIHFIFTSYHRQ